jgi:hypothetical protein
MRRLLLIIAFLLFVVSAIPAHAQAPVWEQVFSFTGAGAPQFPSATPVIGQYAGCKVALTGTPKTCPSITTNSTQYVTPTPNFSQQPLIYDPLHKCVIFQAQDNNYSGEEWSNAVYCIFANASTSPNQVFQLFWDSLDVQANGTGVVTGTDIQSITQSGNTVTIVFQNIAARFIPPGASFLIQNSLVTGANTPANAVSVVTGANCTLGPNPSYQPLCGSFTYNVASSASACQNTGGTSGCSALVAATIYVIGPAESPTRPYDRHTEGSWFDEQRGLYCISTSIGDVSSTPGIIWFGHSGIMDVYCAGADDSPSSTCQANGISGQHCIQWHEYCGFDTVFCSTPNNVGVTTITGNGIPALTTVNGGIGIKFPGAGRDPTNDMTVYFGGQWNSSIQHETLEFRSMSTWVNTNPSVTPTARWFQGDAKLVSLGKYSHKVFMAFGAINGTAGACTTNCLNETDIYDTDTHNWTIAVPNNCSNAALPPCELNAVYDWDPVLGVVVHVDNQNPAHVWYYDPVANLWTDEGNTGAPNLYPCANSGGTGGCLPSSSYPGCAATPTYYNASAAYDASINSLVVGIRFPNCTPGLAALWKLHLPIPIGVQAEEWNGSPAPVATHRPLGAPIESFGWPVPDTYDVAGPTGSPIPFNTNVPQFELEDINSTPQNVQFNCQTVWYPSGNCQWLTIDTQYATSLGFLEGTLQNLFLVQVPSGGGNLPSTPMGSITGTVATINTGAATFTVNLANNDFMHSVVVGTNILLNATRAPVSADGIVLMGPPHFAGTFTADWVSCNPGPATTSAAAYTGSTTCTTPYESVLDGTSTGFFRNNGGMLTDLVVTGNLVNASGDAPVQYTLEYWFWNGHTDYQYRLSLQNAQESTTGNDYQSAGKMKQSVYIQLSPSLAGGNMALTYGTGPTTVATTLLTGGTDTAVLSQGYTNLYEFPDFANTGNCNPTGGTLLSANQFDCVNSPIQRNVVGSSFVYTTPTGWTLTSSESITGLTSGTNVAGWSMQVDTSGNGVEIGLDQMAATYPASLEYTNQGGQLRVGIEPDQTVMGLASPQAYVLGWQEYSHKIGYMNWFTAAPSNPSDVFVEWQQPLIARLPYFMYNAALPIPIPDPCQQQLYYINLSPQPSFASGATSANACTLLGDVNCTSCFGQNNVANPLSQMYRFKFVYSANGGPNQQDIAWAAMKQWEQNGWNGYHMVLAGSQPGKHRWYKNYNNDLINAGGLPHSDFSIHWRGLTWSPTIQSNWGYVTKLTTVNASQWPLIDQQNGLDHAHIAGEPDGYHVTNDYQTQLTIEQQAFPDFFSVGVNPYNTPSLISGTLGGHAVPAATRSAAWTIANMATDLYHLCAIHSPLVWGGSPAGCQVGSLSLIESMVAYTALAPAFGNNFSLPPYNITEYSGCQTMVFNDPNSTSPSKCSSGQGVNGDYLIGLSPNGGSDSCNLVTSIPCDGNNYHVAKPYQNQTMQLALRLFDSYLEPQYRGTRLYSAGVIPVAKDGNSTSVQVPVTGAAVQQSIFGSGLWVLNQAFVLGTSATTSGIDYLTFIGFENRTPPCSNQNADNCSRTANLGGFWGENHTHLGSVCQETNTTVDLYGNSLQQRWDFYIERMGVNGYSELFSPEMDTTDKCILEHNLSNPNSYTVAADVPYLQDLPMNTNFCPASSTCTLTYTLPQGATMINGTILRLTFAALLIQNTLPFFSNCDNTYTEDGCPAASLLTAPAVTNSSGSYLLGQTPATLTPWFASTPVNDPTLQLATGAYVFTNPLTTGVYLDMKVYAPAPAPCVQCYYSSWLHGSDSNAGTKVAPWKHFPGMSGSTISHTVVAGDTFIGEGGDVWPNSAFQMTVGANGTSSLPITWGGEDTTFYDAPSCNAWGTVNTYATVNDDGTATFQSATNVMVGSATTYGFTPQLVGHVVTINGVNYTVVSVLSAANMTVTPNPPNGTGVTMTTSGVYCRPVFDFGNTLISGCTSGLSCAGINMGGSGTPVAVNYNTWDNMDMRRFVNINCVPGPCSHGNMIAYNDGLETVSNNYFHDWSVSGSIVAGSTNNGYTSGYIIKNNTLSQRWTQNSSGNFSGDGIFSGNAGTIITGNVCIWEPDCFDTQASGVSVYNNQMYDMIDDNADTSDHGNTIHAECWGYYYNNLMYNLRNGSTGLVGGSGVSGILGEPRGLCNATAGNYTIWTWNNVQFNYGNQTCFEDRNNYGSTQYSYIHYNETCEVPSTSGGISSNAVRVVTDSPRCPVNDTVINLHVISNSSTSTLPFSGSSTSGLAPYIGIDGGCSTPTNNVVTTSVSMTQAQATTQGYTVANKFAPTTGGSTIAAGTNESALCLGAFPTLCFDILGVARPSAWDAGAYQFVGGGSGSVTLSPSTQTFTSELVGNPSPAQTFTLSNTKAATLTISSKVASGDFSVTGGTCGSTLPTGTCTITAVFTPTALGLRTGTLTVTDSDSTSPQTSALSGVGLAPSTILPPVNLTPLELGVAF